MFSGFYNIVYNTKTAEETQAEEKTKQACVQAETAAWAARPKTYRLIRSEHQNITVQKKEEGTLDWGKILVEKYQPQQSSGYLNITNCSNTFFKTSLTIEKILLDNNRPVRFFTFGCQGNGGAAQLEVARQMDMLLADPNFDPPDFILVLGDNVYDYGASSANDPTFETNFHKIYSQFEHLRKIPFFIILGNHDENLHSMNISHAESDKGIQRGIHEVAHTYFPDARATQNLYRSNTDEKIIDLDLGNLPAWNMPSPAYSLLCGNIQIFCIDSNTYISEYLSFCKGSADKHNQVLWLSNEVKEAREQGRQIILALHHPLITVGKRAFHNDIHLYLSESDIKSPTFQKQFSHLMEGKGPCYNQLLREAFIQQNLVFDAVFTAHDHDMYYYNNKNTVSDYPLCQLTAGGGGGDLQKREDFVDQNQMGCFLKRHGFTIIECPTNGPIEFFLHAIPKPDKNEEKLLLHFNSNTCQPIRIYPDNMENNEINDIKNFCEVVMSALNEYFAFIAENQKKSNGAFLGINLYSGGNTKHNHYGVERAHKIWIYISQQNADDYFTTIAKVYSLSKWDSSYSLPTEHSLITILNKKIAEKFDGRSMESFYQNRDKQDISSYHLV